MGKPSDDAVMFHFWNVRTGTIKCALRMISCRQGEQDMIVSDFTVPELDHFRDNCNFVGNELEVFELRSQGVCLEEIAEMLNMSVENVKRLSRKVNVKISKVSLFTEGGAL